MKNFILFIICCLVLLSCTTNQTEEDYSKDIAEIKDISAKIAQSWNNEDLETFMSFMHNDVMALAPDMAPLNGYEALMETYGNYFEIYDIQLTERIEEVECFGDGAYEWYNWEGSLTPKSEGDPVVFDNKAFYIYKKSDEGAWKVWRIMFNSN